MKPHWQPIALLIVFALAMPCLLFAGSPSDSATYPVDQPIETKMNLGLFGLLGGGMSYSVGGKPITRYKDFKTLIYTQDDREACDLIHSAQEARYAAWMLYWSGVAVGADVAIFFKPTPVLHIPWFDRLATGFVATQIFWAVGAIFDSDGEARKYNAVQRYNHQLDKQDGAFLGFTPQVCLVGQGVGLDLDRPF
jgi:hypothetical protein